MRILIPILLIYGCVAGTASADVEYEFFLVESFNPSYVYSETYVLDINESNRAVGSDTFGGLIWEEEVGKAQLPYSSPKMLNNHNEVLYGHSTLNLDTGAEFFVPAPSAAYPIAVIRHINDIGQAVGSGAHGGPSCEPFDCRLYCSYNMVWDAVNGSRHITGVTDLKAFFGVNNSNVAIGLIVHGCDDEQAVVYDLNTDAWTNLSDLLPPLTIGVAAQTIPTGISDAGHVIGTAASGSGPQQGFIWRADTGFTYLPALAAGEVEYLFPQGVNIHGQVVGAASIDTWQSGNFDYHAFIWDAQRGIRDLHDLTVVPLNFILDEASKINDNGWIVGFGHFGPGWATSRGFVLKPLAPPAVEGDIDGDGDVDASDFQMFASCLGGPTVKVAPAGCDQQAFAAADLDGDQLVNAADFGRFQIIFAQP